MNFFDFFRRKKEPSKAEEQKVLMPDGKMASSRLAALLPQLAPLALPCLRITATPNDNLFQFDSKFGGYPYWPTDKPYPVDSFGQYMYLLAQINCAQMPRLEGYPDKGILQFFLSADDHYGLNFDNPTDQTNFRVVYFEDTTAPAMDNFSFLDGQKRESHIPVSRPMGLTFTPDTDYYGYADVRSHEEWIEELLADDQQVKGRPTLEDELIELYPDLGHKIGGYAYFTQGDPREVAAYQNHILLLQVDSQGDHISWGDYGVGNFFIHPDDLQRRDFSRVLYNWDCT